MRDNTIAGPLSEEGKEVMDLVKIKPKQAAELMMALSREEQVSLVQRQSALDPKSAEDLVLLLDDQNGAELVNELEDKTVFRIMKANTSTHIGILSLLNPDRVQAILDLDHELFSTKGVTDDQTAYHWIVSFLEEDEQTFSRLIRNLDIKVFASAFQDKIKPPSLKEENSAAPSEEEVDAFPADFMVKLDRGELKPDDLEVTDEEVKDILTRAHLVDEAYFNELVSLMIRVKDLKQKTAEEALDRIHEQVGDMSQFTEEAEDMFVPLEE
jgi:hypothetical protein